MVDYKHLHNLNAASNGRAFQGTGVDLNFIPGGGTSLGGVETAAFTEDALAEESSILEVCREWISSSEAWTETSDDMGFSGTAGNDIRSETKEVEEGEEGAEINEKDEGVKEMGLDGERPPNSSRSSVDDRLFVNSLQQDLTCFFRILHLVLVDEIKIKARAAVLVLLSLGPYCW
jgi:hypothetical protein